MAVSGERLTVAWLKSLAYVTTNAGGRVATELPADPTFPFIVVQEIGGGIDRSLAPLDSPYIQLDTYADTKAEADDLALAVIDAARTIDGTPITVAGEGLIYGVDVIAKRAVPEPETGWKRYAVDMILTCREE